MRNINEISVKAISDTVISSRVRLARNVEGYPYPKKIKNADIGLEIIKRTAEALKKIDDFTFYFMKDMSPLNELRLVEKHLISKDLVNNEDISGVFLSSDENISIMLNEEDHIRAQCILKGLNLTSAFEKIDAVDNVLSKNIEFAFDRDFGYLTSCLSNLGTGMRASAMLFLPALTISKSLNDIIEEINHSGLLVRGVYGEGSSSEGFMYQISNDETLGVSEREIIKKVESAVLKICDMELFEREKIYKRDEIGMKDEVLRAYGILTNCAKLSLSEFLKLIAKIKLGISLGILKFSSSNVIDDLIIAGRPATLNYIAGTILDDEEVDVFRAEYIGRQLLLLK